MYRPVQPMYPTSLQAVTPHIGHNSATNFTRVVPGCFPNHQCSHGLLQQQDGRQHLQSADRGFCDGHHCHVTSTGNYDTMFHQEKPKKPTSSQKDGRYRKFHQNAPKFQQFQRFRKYGKSKYVSKFRPKFTDAHDTVSHVNVPYQPISRRLRARLGQRSKPDLRTKLNAQRSENSAPTPRLKSTVIIPQPKNRGRRGGDH